MSSGSDAGAVPWSATPSAADERDGRPGAASAAGERTVPSPRPPRTGHDVPVAVGVFVGVLLALQVFLLTVGIDALLADDDGQAWAAAALSVVLAAGSIGFRRYLR